MIIAANHVRDTHIRIIDDHAKVVGRRAIRTRDDEIIEFDIFKMYIAVYDIFDDHCAGFWILEANNRTHSGSWFVAVATGSVIAWVLFRRSLSCSHRFG